jgi:hypothetical protein
MDSTALLASLERAITVPTYQPRFTTDDLYALLNEEQASRVVPEITSIREEFFVVRRPTAVAQNQYKIDIPHRAVGRTLRQVNWLLQDDTEMPLSRRKLEEINQYGVSSNTPSDFVVIGDQIWLQPQNILEGILVLYYMQRPSLIVPVAQTATITAVGTDSVTVSKLPTNITTNVLADITKYQPGYTTSYTDLVITNITGTTLTFAGFSPTVPIENVVVGDSVSVAGTTSILQLPDESHNFLVQCTAMRVLEALAVPDQLEIAREQVQIKVRTMGDTGGLRLIFSIFSKLL